MASFCVFSAAPVSSSYPADVLALRPGGERLGTDDGVPSHEGDLLVDLRPPLLRSDHRAVVGRQRAVHARLLVDLDKEYMFPSTNGKTSSKTISFKIFKPTSRHELNSLKSFQIFMC